MKFTTKLGCEVSLAEAPEHLGRGLMMTMTINDPGHIRYAEVFLDDESLKQLSNYIVLRHEADKSHEILMGKKPSGPRLYCPNGHGSFSTIQTDCGVCGEVLV